MKALQEKDPFKLKKFNSPLIADFYKWCFLMAVVCGIALISFLVYYLSPYGQFVSSWSYSLYMWNAKDLYTTLKEYYVSFKIGPVTDSYRNKLDYICE